MEQVRYPDAAPILGADAHKAMPGRYIAESECANKHCKLTHSRVKAIMVDLAQHMQSKGGYGKRQRLTSAVCRPIVFAVQNANPAAPFWDWTGFAIVGRPDSCDSGYSTKRQTLSAQNALEVKGSLRRQASLNACAS